MTQWSCDARGRRVRALRTIDFNRLNGLRSAPFTTRAALGWSCAEQLRSADRASTQDPSREILKKNF
jgi:hypothetical protein